MRPAPPAKLSAGEGLRAAPEGNDTHASQSEASVSPNKATNIALVAEEKVAVEDNANGYRAVAESEAMLSPPQGADGEFVEEVLEAAATATAVNSSAEEIYGSAAVPVELTETSGIVAPAAVRVPAGAENNRAGTEEGAQEDTDANRPSTGATAGASSPAVKHSQLPTVPVSDSDGVKGIGGGDQEQNSGPLIGVKAAETAGVGLRTSTRAATGGTIAQDPAPLAERAGPATAAQATGAISGARSRARRPPAIDTKNNPEATNTEGGITQKRDSSLGAADNPEKNRGCFIAKTFSPSDLGFGDFRRRDFRDADKAPPPALRLRRGTVVTGTGRLSTPRAGGGNRKGSVDDDFGFEESLTVLGSLPPERLFSITGMLHPEGPLKVCVPHPGVLCADLVCTVGLYFCCLL